MECGKEAWRGWHVGGTRGRRMRGPRGGYGGAHAEDHRATCGFHQKSQRPREVLRSPRRTRRPPPSGTAGASEVRRFKSCNGRRWTPGRPKSSQGISGRGGDVLEGEGLLERGGRQRSITENGGWREWPKRVGAVAIGCKMPLGSGWANERVRLGLALGPLKGRGQACA